MTHRIRLILPALLGLLALTLAGCTSGSRSTDWFFGDALVIRVRETRLAPEVGYSLGDKHYVIRPSKEGQVIAAVNVEIRNRQASIVILPITKESARLKDSEFFDYLPIDPFQERQEVPQAILDEGKLMPILWADGSPDAPTVDLPQNCGGSPCELKGWMFFEVPKNIGQSRLVISGWRIKREGLQFYQFIWQSADNIYLRY